METESLQDGDIKAAPENANNTRNLKSITSDHNSWKIIDTERADVAHALNVTELMEETHLGHCNKGFCGHASGTA